MSQLQKFEDAKIWRHSIGLSKDVYLLTSTFPDSEQFGLTSQIKRAVNSISANFAEGFGRFSKKDKHHFYTIAYGSLLEVKNFIYLSIELKFCNQNDVKKIIIDIENLQKQFNALKKSLRL
jgi:four helix bundle protein